MNHSVNCDCYDCTGGDAYLRRIKRSVGKAAKWSGKTIAPRSAIYGQVSLPQHVDAPKLNIKGLVGGAVTGFLGDLMQARSEGKEMPKALAKVADMGLKTVDAAKDAARGKVESTIGQKVLKFAPYIVGGILLIIMAVIFAKRKNW